MPQMQRPTLSAQAHQAMVRAVKMELSVTKSFPLFFGDGRQDGSLVHGFSQADDGPGYFR